MLRARDLQCSCTGRACGVMASSAVNACPAWASNLSASGFYYDGLLDQSELEKVLELHKRDTVSTFGTRSSVRVSNEAKAMKRMGKLSKVVLEAEKENHNKEQVSLKCSHNSYSHDRYQEFMMYNNQCVYVCVCVWGGGGGG